MATFPGGSAWAMARDIAEGFILVTERTFRRFELGQVEQLGFELERALRDTRGVVVAVEDLEAVKVRNRKIQRLNAALLMLNSYRQRAFRRGAPPQFDGRS
jgi:hypothetical protein